MNIQKVAQAAGVSVATVSRTFNFPDKVSATTRAKVEAAAARLQYVPNASARSLRTQNTRTIGVLLPTLNNPVFTECLQGIAETAAERGFSIMPFTTAYTLDQELEAVKKLLGFGVEGVILVVSDPKHSPALELLQSTNIPYVLAYNWDPDHPCVSVNNQLAFSEIVAFLADLGHQHIAMVSGQRHASDRAQQRYEGFVKGIEQARLPLLPLIEVPFIDNAVEAIAQALQKERTATALVCSNDLMAIRAIRAAHLCGYQVPRDMSVTGFDGVRLGQDLTPSLTSIAQPNADIGRHSLELLIQHLTQRAPLHAKASLLLTHQLQPAESSAPPFIPHD
ncbi:MAG TPA: LacI family transcriptional regulator [Paenalcaligenes hominis]|uniref:DNA-binding LacI/PurR family transcriptional regulator n=1 Tax=Paenalcaligenes hominis TaxID=643674 RepID=A0A9D3ABI6_9BURK|nr:LacI family DNA-binding transcriptional regulator [Paenalcaligenes hominis]NJB64231.1 DNA-binding LacI/PurR family transcriptional regulator [Paenalcaligenes hominis]GGE69197.1 LacI family transcriptional regulator [Paenalcaligenes hominis]HJH24530.1 LacI family transcriptional regulator [Paenalcaligenes hominis]